MSFETTINRLWDARLSSLGLERRRSRASRAATLLTAGVGGAVVGAALAALFAPVSGRTTRARLSWLAAQALPRQAPPAANGSAFQAEWAAPNPNTTAGA